MVSATLLSTMLLSVTAVYAQQSAYGQCGGELWTGVTSCVDGYVCTASGQYYSQCVPGVVAVVPPAADSGAAPTKTSSASVPPSTAGPGTVLQSGYYWIRAVEAPNFHKYLQSNPLYSEGGAILDTYTTAGQFQIVSGQLVQLITGGFLYAVVEKQANSTVNKLAVSFSKDKNTYGTFAFSGDAVQWSVPDIKRQNLSAWLVCGAKSLWINLGAYGYMTPTGCADETIHYYNDKTAVP